MLPWKREDSIGISLSFCLFTSLAVHNSLLSCLVWIFYTIFVHDPSVCWTKVIPARSLCTHTQNLCPGHNSSLPCLIWTKYHNWFQWPKGVSWPRFKVTLSRSQCVYTQNLCLDHNSLMPRWIWIIFHTIVLHGQGCVICPGGNVSLIA